MEFTAEVDILPEVNSVTTKAWCKRGEGKLLIKMLPDILERMREGMEKKKSTDQLKMVTK